MFHKRNSNVQEVEPQAPRHRAWVWRCRKVSSSSPGHPDWTTTFLCNVFLSPLPLPCRLGPLPCQSGLPTFDPSPPVMYMRNTTCNKELSAEQRVKASVTAVPPDPVQSRSLLTYFSPGIPCPLSTSQFLQLSQTEKCH